MSPNYSETRPLDVLTVKHRVVGSFWETQQLMSRLGRTQHETAQIVYVWFLCCW